MKHASKLSFILIALLHIPAALALSSTNSIQVTTEAPLAGKNPLPVNVKISPLATYGNNTSNNTCQYQNIRGKITSQTTIPLNTSRNGTTNPQIICTINYQGVAQNKITLEGNCQDTAGEHVLSSYPITGEAFPTDRSKNICDANSFKGYTQKGTKQSAFTVTIPNSATPKS